MNRMMGFFYNQIIIKNLHVSSTLKSFLRLLTKSNFIKASIHIFFVLAIILNISPANAAKRKRGAPDESGYVQRALEKDKEKEEKKTDSETPEPKIPSPAARVAAKKRQNAVPAPMANKKAPSKRAPKKEENVWLPEMGENPDTPKVIEERKEEAVQEKKLLNDLLGLNYKTHIPPKELYGRLDGDNKHLPPVYFQSNYLEMIYKAIDKKDFNNLRTLLANYKFINQRHEDGDTILMYAIQNDSLNAVRILLAKGALVNALNGRKRTALHYAAALGNLDSLKLLLTMGANPFLKDDNDMTAMDYAQVAQQPRAEAILGQYLSQE